MEAVGPYHAHRISWCSLTCVLGISSWCGLRQEFHLFGHMLYSLGPLRTQLDHIMYIGFREVVWHACLGYHHDVVSEWSSHTSVDAGRIRQYQRISYASRSQFWANIVSFFWHAPAKKCPRMSGPVFVMKLIVSLPKRGHKWALFLSSVFVPDSFFSASRFCLDPIQIYEWIWEPSETYFYTYWALLDHMGLCWSIFAFSKSYKFIKLLIIIVEGPIYS